MPNQRTETVVIVKLAGIGDVATACRAFNETLGDSKKQLSIHWMMDPLFIPLARQLIKARDTIAHEFHGISSSKIFQGTPLQKLREALKLAQTLILVRPNIVALLHRDHRYKIFVRPVFWGKLIQIADRSSNELTVYKKALTDGVALQTPNRNSTSEESGIPPASMTGIGILIGGAQGTKVSFIEKRWPHWEKLVLKLLQNTQEVIYLFGGPDDRADADAIMKSLGNLSEKRLINRVAKTPLSDLPSELKSLKTFVSIDSGLHHIAASVMTSEKQKIIALFGPTNPALWGAMTGTKNKVETLYRALPCSPCYHNDGRFKPCIYNGADFQKCMTTISVDDVFRQIVQ